MKVIPDMRRVTLVDFNYLVQASGFIPPTTLNYLSFWDNVSILSIPDEWIFQKRVVRTKFDICAFIVLDQHA